ncbi:MAG: hypothetical protein HY815_14030, partial [Candidatus Riflebacteria bacterium]|nr:hypothetical protein [Candidatus Riflebacteria bacterium]
MTSRWLWSPIILAALLVVYRPLLREPTFFFEDHALVREAGSKEPVAELFRIEPSLYFHRPLGRLIWRAVHGAFADEPLAYQATSLLLHWVNCLLLIGLSRRLAPRRPALAVAAGLVFALYPLQVETVAWKSCWYDLISTLFYLWTVVLFLDLRGSGSPLLVPLSMVTMQCCLWSKELAFTLPVLLLGLHCLLEGPRHGRATLALACHALLLVLDLGQRVALWGRIGGYPHLTDYF